MRFLAKNRPFEVIYIINVEGSRSWIVGDSDMVPTGSTFRAYPILEKENYQSALQRALELAESYRGKTWGEADLPGPLI